MRLISSGAETQLQQKSIGILESCMSCHEKEEKDETAGWSGFSEWGAKDAFLKNKKQVARKELTIREKYGKGQEE